MFKSMFPVLFIYCRGYILALSPSVMVVQVSTARRGAGRAHSIDPLNDIQRHEQANIDRFLRDNKKVFGRLEFVQMSQ